MKKLFIFIAVVLCSILLGLYIKQDSGYILISYKTWIIELSLWLGVIFIVLTVITVHKLLGFLSFVLDIPQRTKLWFRNHQQKKAFSQTSEGLLKLAEGNYKKAEKLLIKSAKKQYKPLINYLTAARAAQGLSDINKRDEYLRKAFECSPKSGLSIGLMQADLQLKNQEYEAALATLNHLQIEYGHNKLVLRQLLLVFIKLKDWHNVIRILPELARYRLSSTEEIQNYEILAAKGYFRAIIANLSALSYEQLKLNLQEFFNNYLSAQAKYNNEVVYAYIKALCTIKDKYYINTEYFENKKNNQELEILAISLIDKTLKVNEGSSKSAVKSVESQNKLFKLFAELGSSAEHLIVLEKYLKYEQYNLNLLFALGKIAIKHENYDKAFQYLNQAKKLEEQNKLIQSKLPIDNYFAFVLLKLGRQQESLNIFNNYFKAYQQA